MGSGLIQGKARSAWAFGGSVGLRLKVLVLGPETLKSSGVLGGFCQLAQPRPQDVALSWARGEGKWA